MLALAEKENGEVETVRAFYEQMAGIKLTKADAEGEPLAVLEEMAAQVRKIHTELTDAAIKIQSIQRGKAVRNVKKAETDAVAKEAEKKKKGAKKKK